MNKYKLSVDVANSKSFRHFGEKYNPKTITQKQLKKLYKSGCPHITEIKGTKKITKNEEIEENNAND